VQGNAAAPSASRAARFITGVALPRMMARPRTNEGAPASCSTGSGRIVSAVCAIGTAQNREPAHNISTGREDSACTIGLS
jgi:hypothetical protein